MKIWTGLICTLLFFLSGCASYRPPERVIVSLYPTIQPMTVLEIVTPVKLTDNALKTILVQCRLNPLLLQAGFREKDYQLLSRGMQERGYCEIDCRRAKSRLIWIALEQQTAGGLVVRACFDTPPPSSCLFGITLSDSTKKITYIPGAYGGLRKASCWQGITQTGMILVRQIDSIYKNRPAYWEVAITPVQK